MESVIARKGHWTDREILGSAFGTWQTASFKVEVCLFAQYHRRPSGALRKQRKGCSEDGRCSWFKGAPGKDGCWVRVGMEE